QDNTYTGKGAGNHLDYAVEVSAGAIAVIRDNTIGNNLGQASSDGSVSAGVLVSTYFGAGSQATIGNNTFTDNTLGVAIGFDGSDTSNVVFETGNTFAGGDYGVVVVGDALVNGIELVG